MGCDYKDTTHFGGIWAAGNADITIACLGLTPVYEGEEGDAFLSEYGADRKTLSLPAAHIAYLKALRKRTKNPIILVINAGSAIDVDAVAPYADEHVVFDSAEVIEHYLDEDPSATFLGDELVFEDGYLTKGLEQALGGLESAVLTRELHVNRITGAMSETVYAVRPDSDTNSVFAWPLKSRMLRTPLAT